MRRAEQRARGGSGSWWRKQRDVATSWYCGTPHRNRSWSCHPFATSTVASANPSRRALVVLLPGSFAGCWDVKVSHLHHVGCGGRGCLHKQLCALLNLHAGRRRLRRGRVAQQRDVGLGGERPQRVERGHGTVASVYRRHAVQQHRFDHLCVQQVSWCQSDDGAALSPRRQRCEACKAKLSECVWCSAWCGGREKCECSPPRCSKPYAVETRYSVQQLHMQLKP